MMRLPKRMIVRSSLMAAVLMLAACSSASEVRDDSVIERTSTTSVAAESTSSSAPTTTTIPGNVSVHLDESVVSGVVAQAATELGVEASGLRPVVAIGATWSDGSLNCPEPDVSYTQGQVDGLWVVLTDGALIYDYRAGPDGQFRYCAAGGPPSGTHVDS